MTQKFDYLLFSFNYYVILISIELESSSMLISNCSNDERQNLEVGTSLLMERRTVEFGAEYIDL